MSDWLRVRVRVVTEQSNGQWLIVSDWLRVRVRVKTSYVGIVVTLTQCRRTPSFSVRRHGSPASPSSKRASTFLGGRVIY